ncbi:MAG: cupin domain-containing protein [Saprospiraceae bacterium]|nr:cupin domain-containing protein [Saprospiraceae bacterium]
MRYFFSFILCLSLWSLNAQSSINSNVFSGQTPGILFQGDATAVKNVEFELLQNKANKTYKKSFKKNEGIVFIKKGSAEIQTNRFSKTLTPGSIALISQWDKLKLKSPSGSPVEFYLFSYQSKNPVNQGDTAASFARVWEDLRFNKHERGGVRSYFSKPTSQTKRFEMHVTTLLGGLPSHPPHTHLAEEIILVIEGETEMEIGGSAFKGVAGDGYFVKSQEPHGIKNIGKNSCSYFAFQWE